MKFKIIILFFLINSQINHAQIDKISIYLSDVKKAISIIDTLSKEPTFIRNIINDSTKLEIDKQSYFNKNGFDQKFINYFTSNKFNDYILSATRIEPVIEDCNLIKYIIHFWIKSKNTEKVCVFLFTYYPINEKLFLNSIWLGDPIEQFNIWDDH
jgi:hypothetical protein